MKFRVERDALADAAAWTAKSLPNRPPVPILAGVLLSVRDGRLEVSGFDYEVSNQVSIDVQADTEGTTLVSGKLLSEITRALPNKPVDFATDGSRVEIACGSARFTLPTLPLEDYPTLPEMPPGVGTVDSSAFASAVAQVVFAAGRDSTIPALIGVRLKFERELITLTATDRYRLATREMHWRPDDPEFASTVLVPSRILAETARTLGGLGGEATLAMSNSGRTGSMLMGFVGGGRRTTSGLIADDYPDVDTILRQSYPHEVHVPVSALTEVVKRVALVAERNTPVRLSFDNDVLTVKAGGSDDTRASETLECRYSGDAQAIAFNPAFLLDALGALDHPTARMSLSDAMKPAVITSVGGDDEVDPSYRHVLMPVRVASTLGS